MAKDNPHFLILFNFNLKYNTMIIWIAIKCKSELISM